VSGRAIGGQLRLAALALLVGGQGRQYRASDRETLRAAAVELQGRGLTLRDIGQALGIADAAVRELLA
jgi:hypothetical protein